MEFKDLYTIEDKQVLKDAEDSLDPKADRVQEIIEYAKHVKSKSPVTPLVVKDRK